MIGWRWTDYDCGDVAEERIRLKRYRRPSWSVAEEAFDLKSAPVGEQKFTSDTTEVQSVVLLWLGQQPASIILGIYRGKYSTKSLIFPQKLVNCVRVFRLDSLLQVYRCSSEWKTTSLYCISVSTVMLHMASKSQFNTTGWQRRVYTQW